MNELSANPRKNVFFNIDNEYVINCEFSERNTIQYMKIYLRDSQNLNEFNIYFCGHLIKNDHLPLYKFFYLNPNAKNIIFHIETPAGLKKHELRTYTSKLSQLKSRNATLSASVLQLETQKKTYLSLFNESRQKSEKIMEECASKEEEILRLKDKIAYYKAIKESVRKNRKSKNSGVNESVGNNCAGISESGSLSNLKEGALAEKRESKNSEFSGEKNGGSKCNSVQNVVRIKEDMGIDGNFEKKNHNIFVFDSKKI